MCRTPEVRSVSFSRLPSLPISADSFVGDAALIAVMHIAQRFGAAQIDVDASNRLLA